MLISVPVPVLVPAHGPELNFIDCCQYPYSNKYLHFKLFFTLEILIIENFITEQL